MKIKQFLLMGILTSFVFVSCRDDNKKDDMETGMEETEMGQMEDPNMDLETEDTMETTTVADIAMGSEKHTTLVSAIKGAGMAMKLNSEGPWTVFAPTNEAFEELPDGTLDNLMKPENSEKLEAILSYHIVPGNVDSAKLKDLIKSNESGKYELVTANDGTIWASINDAGTVILTDGSGSEIAVVAADMRASNGVVHSIDGVLMRE